MIIQAMNTLVFPSIPERVKGEVVVARLGYFPLIVYSKDRVLGFREATTASLIMELILTTQEEQTT